LPLLIACTFAHLVSVLALRRSILTEKVARRGFHVMREYVVDPLEALFVRDVMTTSIVSGADRRSGGSGSTPSSARTARCSASSPGPTWWRRTPRAATVSPSPT